MPTMYCPSQGSKLDGWIRSTARYNHKATPESEAIDCKLHSDNFVQNTGILINLLIDECTYLTLIHV